MAPSPTPSPLPVPNSLTPFWRTSPHPLDNHRSTPELPSEVDIAVIGSGYAGASTVHHIQKQCAAAGRPLPSIAIFEARQACSGATGRNGGHLKPDPYNRASSLAATHGVAAAAEAAAFEFDVLRAVKRVVDEEKIDCEFVLTRAVDALMSDGICTKMKGAYEMLRAHGVGAVEDVHFVAGKKAEQLSGVKGAKGCLSYPAGHLYPYKLILHLLSSAVRAGVNLQTHTPVTQVSSAPDAQGYHTITTPRGVLRARKVVFATNAYTSHLLPAYAGKIIPSRGICSHIDVPADKKPAPTLVNSYIIRWNASDYEYLIPRLDGSIVVGGARETFYGDLGSWYGNVRDDQLIDQAKGYFDGYMQRVFRGWENTGARVEHLWTGIMGYSSDGSPHVGKVPGRQSQFILAGFTGHGMPQVFLAAKGVAKMLLDDVAFGATGVPRIYETSQARLDSKTNGILESWGASQSVQKAKL